MTIARVVIELALAALFAVMGALHFVPGFARGMGAMIPQRLRGPFSARALVRFTGVCELAGATGLVLGLGVPWLRIVTAVALILFLIAVFPANAYAAAHRDRFGAAATPLVPRAIAQLALVGLLVFVALTG